MRKFASLFTLLIVAALIFAGLPAANAQSAVELRMIWYNDGNEGDVMRELLDRFQAQNPNIKVTMEILPFADLEKTMITQVEGGTAPDMARLTNIPRFAGKYLDLTPYLPDAAAWRANFPENVLATYRAPGDKDGLHGFPTQFTVTGPFINATKFAEAGVEIPTGNTTFRQWVELAKEVATKTNTPYAVAIDRSLHRTMGPILSLGGQWVDKATGKITYDNPATREFMQMLVDWHKEGITPRNIWVGEGDKYAAGDTFFVNGELVFYFSGSWQIGKFTNEIGDKFDWRVVPQPCGSNAPDAICSAMPGGASLMAMGSTKFPKETAMVMEYLSREEILAEFSARTLFLPGHLGLIEKGVDYKQSKEALNAFAAMIPNISEQGYLFQLSALTGPMNSEMRTRIAQAIVGEITLDEAIKAVQKLADDICAAEPFKCPPLN